MSTPDMFALLHEWLPVGYVTVAPLVAVAFSMICKRGESETRRTGRRLGNSAMRRVMLGAQFGVRVHRAANWKAQLSMLPLVMLLAVVLIGLLTLSQLVTPEARALALEVGPILYVCIAPLVCTLMAICGPYFEKPADEETGRPSRLGRGVMRRAAMRSIQFIIRGQRTVSAKTPRAVSAGARCRSMLPLAAITTALVSLGLALFYNGVPLDIIREALPIVYVCATPMLSVLHVSTATCRERAAERVVRMGQRMMRRAARQFELEPETPEGGACTNLLRTSQKVALQSNFESVDPSRDMGAAAPAADTAKKKKATEACATMASVAPSTPSDGMRSFVGSAGGVVGSGCSSGATGATRSAGVAPKPETLSKTASPPAAHTKGSRPNPFAATSPAGAVPVAQAQGAACSLMETTPSFAPQWGDTRKSPDVKPRKLVEHDHEGRLLGAPSVVVDSRRVHKHLGDRKQLVEEMKARNDEAAKQFSRSSCRVS